MTTKYQCDRCGAIMDFDDDKSVVIAVGAGRSGGSLDSNKQLDLCPPCFNAVEKYVGEGVIKRK